MAFKRFNVSLSENVLEYMDSEAERVGLSRSGMIAFMVEQYRTQREAMGVVGAMDKLEEIQKALQEKEV